MKRPEFLRSCTVGEVRKEVKQNLKSLEHTGWIMANGFADVPPEYERWINVLMSEFVIQQEYLRDREANNWGWDKKTVDFSKTV